MASISGRYGSVTLTNADEYVKNWTLDYNADLYETTNFDDSSGGRSYIGGYTGWSGTFEANYSTANTVVPGDTGTIVLKTSTGATGFWSGDVWKSIVNFKLNRKDLDIFVIDTDTGLGVIKKNDNKNENQKIQEVPNWDYFNIHRKELLNLITSYTNTS